MMTAFVTGKCPACGTRPAHIKCERIKLEDSNGRGGKGMTYLCPSCSVILGVSPDPIAMVQEIKNAIKAP